jgi:hypothetical protein
MSTFCIASYESCLSTQMRIPSTFSILFYYTHKVLTYKEYRAVSGVFRTIDPPPPFPPSECVLPPHLRRRGTHSPGGKGVGGSIFRKTPDIGLASYSIIPLRLYLMIVGEVHGAGGEHRTEGEAGEP